MLRRGGSRSVNFTENLELCTLGGGSHKAPGKAIAQAELSRLLAAGQSLTAG